MQLRTLHLDSISSMLLCIMKYKHLVLQMQAVAGAMVIPGKADFVMHTDRLF